MSGMLFTRLVFRRVVLLAVFCAVCVVILVRHTLLLDYSYSSSGPGDLPELKVEDEAPNVLKVDLDLINSGNGNSQGSTFHEPIEHAAFDQMEDGKSYDVHRGKLLIGKITTFKNPKAGNVQSEENDKPIDPSQRENATFFSLVRNEDFLGILRSIESVESRFNKKYHYDWVFANHEPFSDIFKSSIASLVSGKATFVEIPLHHWTFPDWLDMEKVELTKQTMKQQNVKYGDSDSYRHMCRFFSGFFFNLPIMKKYKYYWRVEPNIKFDCDLFETDWFKYMRQNHQKYAFVLAPLELHNTVTNLWKYTKIFMDEHPELIHPNNALEFVTDDDGNTFNMCHFWSNFEIGDLDFFRLKQYQTFFNHLDRAGGIYYSRWGDAPIHSIGVTMLLLRTEILYLGDTGYNHMPNRDCPRDAVIREKKRCTCDPKDEHSWSKWSCIPRWYEMNEFEKPLYADFEFVNNHKFENDMGDEDW